MFSKLISTYPENIAWYIENSRYDSEHYKQTIPYPHMRVRKTYPQLVIYSLYCCCTYSPRISQPTASRAG